VAAQGDPTRLISEINEGSTKNMEDIEQLADVVRDLGITIEVVTGARKLPADTSWKPAKSWTVTLTRALRNLPPGHHVARVIGVLSNGTPLYGHTLVVDFYGGAAATSPSAADVLMSVVSDAAGVEGRTFEEWADDFGIDTDSRKGEKIYNACKAIAPEVRAFLGEHFDRVARAEH
jgi:hypothetical protein